MNSKKNKSTLNKICKNYFLIDDMIHPQRLLELTKLFNKYDIMWACQLRLTIDFTKEILQTLADSGIKFLMWGGESGNNRILKKKSKRYQLKRYSYCSLFKSRPCDIAGRSICFIRR